MTYKSPNYDSRPLGVAPDMLILHYTDMENVGRALARLCSASSKVSAHYCIEKNGRVHNLVPETQRAWHAGVSYWGGVDDVNNCSIGIELDHCGYDSSGQFMPPFAEAQMQSLIALAGDIVARHAILAHRVLGHSDVAPARKIDPGEAFDWARLARCGIGLWPDGKLPEIDAPTLYKANMKGAGVGRFQSLLRMFGYGLEVSGVYDFETKSVVRAFQRHYRSNLVDGIGDVETQKRLNWLIAAQNHLDFRAGKS